MYMRKALHLFSIRFSLVLLLGLLFQLPAVAQPCTPTAVCTPGNATNSLIGPFGTGIDSLKLGSLALRAGRAPAGYQNLACTQFVQVPIGSILPVRVRTSNNVNENLRVWADWNNDGDFDPTGELVFSSNNVRVHVGSIATPSTARTDTILRLRFATEIATGTIPGTCGTPDYGQFVDVGVLLIPNLLKPIASFTSADSITCSGTVQFTDLSINAPTTWFWEFGDGNVSTVSSPRHTYTTAGNYTIRLIVSNGNGADTLRKPFFVSYRDSLPIAPVCTPVVNAPCCGYGLANFRLGGIDTRKLGASIRNGYDDFTCQFQAELLPGVRYPFRMNVNRTLAQDVRMYVDFNSNGNFSDPGELIWTRLNARDTASGVFSTPNQVLLNQRLRMRIVADYAGTPANSCFDVANGAVQDFTIYFRTNVNPPQALARVQSTDFCTPTYVFQSISQNSIDSLFWNFGDGSATVATLATQTTVTHTYTSTGIFNVTLIAVGPFGRDTVVLPSAAINLINPVQACAQQRAANVTQGYGIFNVRLGSINITTNGAADGYLDRTCTQVTTLVAGSVVPYSITMSRFNPEQAIFYLDANNDGQFSNNERVTNVVGTSVQSGSFIAPSNVQTGTILRMRVVSDGSAVQINPCRRPSFGQVIDFGVVMLPNNLKPVANFGTASTYTCNRTVSFVDSSLNVPTNWRWYFGDGDSSLVKNPTHEYTTPGTYTITLIAGNPQGFDTLVLPNYVTIIPGGIRASACVPTVSSSCCNTAARQIKIGTFTFNEEFYNGANAYRDFACSSIFSGLKGKPLPFELTSFALVTNVAVYVDYNNNGVFDGAAELAFSGRAQQVHKGLLQISQNAVMDTVLRVRVLVDNNVRNDATPPCGPMLYGQTIDFGLLVRGATAAPAAGFMVSETTSCNGLITFTDTTTQVIDNFLWTFGDGNTSTVSNPTHQYQTPGIYTVKLVVRNNFGADSVEKVSYVNVTGTWGPRVAAANCRPATLIPGTTTGILRTQFVTIDKSSGSAQEGYQDFTCTDSTTILARVSYPIEFTLPGGLQLIRVYMDVNDNGVLENNEMLLSANAQGTLFRGNINLVPGFSGNQVWNKFIRMRVMAAPVGTIANGCDDLSQGQAEDYAVRPLLVTNLENELLKAQLKLYPNPAKDVVTLECPEAETQVQLLSVTGKPVWTGTHLGGKLDIPVAQLGRGLYFLQVQSGNARAVQKLILD